MFEQYLKSPKQRAVSIKDAFSRDANLNVTEYLQLEILSVRGGGKEDVQRDCHKT